MITSPSSVTGLIPQLSAEVAATPCVGRVEEPMVCWTQLLRETEPEVVGPARPLPPMEDDASLGKLFAGLHDIDARSVDCHE